MALTGARRLGIAAATAMSTLALAQAAAAGVPPAPIPEGPGAGDLPACAGPPATPSPVAAPQPPRHPFMAPNGRSNIHGDAYMTDTYTWSGPLGGAMRRLSTFLGAECASITFDAAGRLETTCVGLDGPKLALFDQHTLELLAALPLPPRQPGGASPFTDF